MERQANEGSMTLLDGAIPQAARDVTTPPPGTGETSLRGTWLIVARATWLIIVLVSLAFFGISLPTYFAQAQSVCTGTGCIGLAQSDLRALRAAGISPAFYAACLVVFAVLYILIWSGIAAVLFWRKSADRMALFTGLTLVTFSIIQTNTLTVLPADLAWFNHLIRILASICFIVFFYLFPTGRFVPRWTRWLSIVEVIYWVENEYINLNNIPYSFFFWLSTVLFVASLLSVVISQVYRYRRVSGPVQQQQTKWVVFGIALTVVVYLGIILLSVPFPAIQQGLLGTIFGSVVFPLALLPIPLSIGFAIVRSRLWDIDLIINRALVYGILTALLVAIYAGLVIGLQALLRSLFHQTSGVAIVASTLAIAALSQPLRRRIQNIIDRRFYRSKYDAAKILAAFSATVRDEVDLEQIRAQLLAVVQETMQPAHVSLWLRTPERPQKAKEV
jgi:hypothetical protein